MIRQFQGPAGSLEAAQIEVWWVDQAGTVHRP